ncbi:MAG: DUF4416 family protein [Candidatus Omnitrophota bacterium]
MGVPVEQKPVKLIASIIFKDEGDLYQAERRLRTLFGPFESLEKSAPFGYTDYYREEMGHPLKRKLICFKNLIDPEKMYKVKLRTNRIEYKISADRKRKVNIDPGYVTEAKLVLLTTKDYTHRIYIRGRIFAETTLSYQDGGFKPWPWTYPDYASKELRDYFEKVREIYINDIKGISDNA